MGKAVVRGLGERKRFAESSGIAGAACGGRGLDEGACPAVKNIGKSRYGGRKPHARFYEGGLAKAAKAWLLRHRQAKEAETDRRGLKSPEPALYSTHFLLHAGVYYAQNAAGDEIIGGFAGRVMIS